MWISLTEAKAQVESYSLSSIKVRQWEEDMVAVKEGAGEETKVETGEETKEEVGVAIKEEVEIGVAIKVGEEIKVDGEAEIRAEEIGGIKGEIKEDGVEVTNKAAGDGEVIKVGTKVVGVEIKETTKEDGAAQVGDAS